MSSFRIFFRKEPMVIPHSSAFVSINRSGTAELPITFTNNIRLGRRTVNKIIRSSPKDKMIRFESTWSALFDNAGFIIAQMPPDRLISLVNLGISLIITEASASSSSVNLTSNNEIP